LRVVEDQHVRLLGAGDAHHLGDSVIQIAGRWWIPLRKTLRPFARIGGEHGERRRTGTRHSRHVHQSTSCEPQHRAPRMLEVLHHGARADYHPTIERGARRELLEKPCLAAASFGFDDEQRQPTRRMYARSARCEKGSILRACTSGASAPNSSPASSRSSAWRSSASMDRLCQCERSTVGQSSNPDAPAILKPSRKSPWMSGVLWAQSRCFTSLSS